MSEKNLNIKTIIVAILIIAVLAAVIVATLASKKDTYADPNLAEFRNGNTVLVLNTKTGGIPNIPKNKEALTQLAQLKPMTISQLRQQAQAQRQKGDYLLANYLDRQVARREIREGYDTFDTGLDYNKKSQLDLLKEHAGEQAECEQSCWLFLLMEKCNATAALQLGEDPHCSWPCPYSDWHIIGGCMGFGEAAWMPKIESALDKIREGARWMESNIGLKLKQDMFKKAPSSKISDGPKESSRGYNQNMFRPKEEERSFGNPIPFKPNKNMFPKEEGSTCYAAGQIIQSNCEQVKCMGKKKNMSGTKCQQDVCVPTIATGALTPVPQDPFYTLHNDEKSCCTGEVCSGNRMEKTCGGETFIGELCNVEGLTAKCVNQAGTGVMKLSSGVTIPSIPCKPSDYTQPKSVSCQDGKLVIGGNVRQVECVN